jgi:RNA polymerase sigma-70 factor (ECF subfamily)
MTSDQWQRCLAAARAGSADELGRILDGCRPYLWVIARDEIGVPLQAKVGGSDLVQESLLAASRDFGRFEGESPDELQAWLRGILRHVISHHRRKYLSTDRRRVGREVSIDGDSGAAVREGLAVDDETPSHLIDGKEQRDRVRAALGELPPHYQEVIRLRSDERRSFEEIGRKLNRTADGARMLWGRAVRKLQSRLESPP